MTSPLADIARLCGDDAEAIELYNDAMGDFQAAGDQRCTASTYKNLATIAAASDEHGAAYELFARAVRLRHDLGDEAGLAECFEGMAAVEITTGRLGSAAEHRASSARVREGTGSLASEIEAAATSSMLDQLRSGLDSAFFEAAFTRGGQRSVAEAVDHALSATPATWHWADVNAPARLVA